MSVYKKLMDARLMMQDVPMNKSGRNDYAGYDYFKLADFLPEAQRIFREVGLCGIVRFANDFASLEIVDTENPGGERITITSPMGSAALKGCHEVQNIGAVESYQRRYLWMTAFEIVEDDGLDATTAKPSKKETNRGTPLGGVWESLDEEAQAFLSKIAEQVKATFNSEGADAAADHLKSQNLDNDEKAAIWTRFDSKTRSALTKALKKPKES